MNEKRTIRTKKGAKVNVEADPELIKLLAGNGEDFWATVRKVLDNVEDKDKKNKN